MRKYIHMLLCLKDLNSSTEQDFVSFGPLDFCTMSTSFYYLCCHYADVCSLLWMVSCVRNCLVKHTVRSRGT